MKEHMPQKYQEIPPQVLANLQQPEGLPIPIADVPRIPVSDRMLRRLQTQKIAELMLNDFKSVVLQGIVVGLQVMQVLQGRKSLFEIDWDPDIEDIYPELAASLEEKKIQLWHAQHELALRRTIRQELRNKSTVSKK